MAGRRISATSCKALHGLMHIACRQVCTQWHPEPIGGSSAGCLHLPVGGSTSLLGGHSRL